MRLIGFIAFLVFGILGGAVSIGTDNDHTALIWIGIMIFILGLAHWPEPTKKY